MLHSTIQVLHQGQTTLSTQQQIADFIRYKNNPWDFLSECVYTRDAVDQDNPIKLYPGEREYLRLFAMLWQKEKMIAVPKSRRMTMSWTVIALTLWDVIFHKGREHAFVSKKEDDSAELVARAEFIFNRIPNDKIPKALLPKIRGKKMTKSPPRLVFDFGQDEVSYIAGFPMGADQLRQFTFSGIFGDEAAFWEVAEEFYTGAKPTLDGGGRMVLVSSRAPGFFKKIVFDQINSKDDNYAEIAPVPIKRPLQGIEIWKNPKNKFLIIDIHYTADPEKRAPEFRENLLASLPVHQFMREYERSWSTFIGQPVYPNFRNDIHLPMNKPQAHYGLPLLFGWDFGHTPAAIVCQLQGNSLKILKEWVTKNEAIRTFAPKVMKEVQQLWPEWGDPNKDHIHFIDPAGFKRNENDMRSCALEMEEHAGITNLNPGPITWEDRRSAVETFLLYVDKDGAGMEINEGECNTLVTGFKGGYRYADSVNELQPDKVRPLKNYYSHVHDAFQYVCAGAKLNMTEPDTDINIPTPSYGFQKESATSSRRPDYGRK